MLFSLPAAGAWPSLVAAKPPGQLGAEPAPPLTAAVAKPTAAQVASSKSGGAEAAPAGLARPRLGAAVVAVWRALVNGDGQFHGFCASLGTAAERDRLVTLEPTHGLRRLAVRLILQRLGCHTLPNWACVQE